MRKRSVFMIIIVTATVGAAVVLAAAGRTVYYHGQAMTHDVRQVNGHTYVPLADVARALGGRVAARGADLEIVTGGGSTALNGARPAGGAHPVQGLTGNVGDWLFTGLWQFRVSHMARVTEYHDRYAQPASTDKPSSANDELVVLECSIKNTHQTADQPILTAHGLASQNTALADIQGQSYAPLDFDARGGSLIAGAAKDFAVVFSVPKGTKLKDLVFTLYGFSTSNKASNVRVHLGDQ